MMQSLETLFFKLDIHSIPPLIVGFLMLVLGIITLIKDRASRVSSSFFMITLSIFVWLGSSAWLYSASSEHQAFLWAWIEHFGAAFIPSFTFIFTLDIIRRYKKYKYFSWATLILSGLFCAGFVFSSYLIEGVILMPWGYYALYGPYGLCLILYLGLFMLISLDLIWIEYLQSTSEREKSRLKGIFLGIAIGLLGAVDFIPAFGIQVYPIGYIPVFVCALILGQTIMRFKLVDLTPSFAANHILKTMEALVAVVDLEGRISVVNPPLCELLGYRERELKDKKISLIFDTDENNFPKKLDKDWILRNQEMEWKKKEGTKVEMSVSASAITDKSREAAGIVYIATDITERKKAEKELAWAKESAEQANQAKSEFLANMSHEIRTPLSAVTGFSDLLSDTPLRDIQKDYVNTIRESGKLLLDLISNILDFSKIEARQIQLENIDFNLKKLVEDVMKIARPKVKSTKIELYYHYDKTVPTNFKGDPTRVRQIILNLLNNSIKFTEQGEIGIHVLPAKTKKSDLKMEDSSYAVQISVIDTGIGIPKNKQKMIFNAFSQADSSTTRRFGGTGLGLAITRALVEKMGGEIWVESKKGKGSKFTFTLKLKESAPSVFAGISQLRIKELKGKTVLGDRRPEGQIVTTHLAEELTAKKIMVLVAEDNPVNQKLIKILLQRLGCEAEIVSNGKEALERAMTKEYDVCLMDVHMPIMSGIDATKQIRKRGNTALPIIALTALALRDGKEECLKAGMNDFLTQPVEPQKLKQKIMHWTGNKQIKALSRDLLPS